ncbi:MAG: FAD-binding oxidoreductase, partial [Planctomycetota bacterium]
MSETQISRREALIGGAALALAGCVGNGPDADRDAAGDGVFVNDVHARLSRTRVREVVEPTTPKALAKAIATSDGASICGGRYCSGGQPFLRDGRLIDMRHLDRVLNVDAERGLITAEAGIRWPKLMAAIEKHAPKWAIQQKQSGADEVSLGGTLSVNAHGRCLAAAPIVQDVEAIDLLDRAGNVVRCTRTNNPERFRRVIGGYGLFGAMTSVTLRLVPKRPLVMRVQVATATNAVGLMDEAAGRGATHGDFQYNVDADSPGFMREGLVVTYEPTDARPNRKSADVAASFTQLAVAAHLDKSAAWAGYRRQMLGQDGAVDWNGAWQAATYVAGYHQHVDAATDAPAGSEVLSEVFVPRERLAEFLAAMGEVIRRFDADIIYGNVRLI